MIDKSLLISSAQKGGLAISPQTADLFDTYAELLVSYNKSINLTAITEPEEIVTKHFLDCILPCPSLDIPNGASVIDVGTGAGFPGIPIALTRPDIKLTLLDSLAKRLRVLEDITSEISITAALVHSRAEEASRKAPLRDGFDIAVSRAVASLDKLCEYCLPYVKPGGSFYAFKGPAAADEVAAAGNAIRLLGGKPDGILEYDIPGTDMRHCVVKIKKLSETPAKYPRQSAKITAKPL